MNKEEETYQRERERDRKSKERKREMLEKGHTRETHSTASLSYAGGWMRGEEGSGKGNVYIVRLV